MSLQLAFFRLGYLSSAAFFLSLAAAGVGGVAGIAWAQEGASTSTSAAVEEQGKDEATAEAKEKDEDAAESPRRFRRPVVIDTITWEPEEGLAVTLVYSNRLRVTEPDYANLTNAQPGEVVVLTTCAAPKFRTDFHLLFGETRIERDNVAENYPGVYSLWLKKTTEGWNLVFNWKADVWGTMHDPEADVAEIPLDYTFEESEAKAIATLLLAEEKPKDAPRFKAQLTEVNGEVLFTMEWGPHHWSTRFTTA